tara:strand:+ start:15105 stop:15338 length:234 start_codon:yes stop_codon:yes gene_type:complete
LAAQQEEVGKPQVRARGVLAPFLLDGMNAVLRKALPLEKRLRGHTIRTSATPGRSTSRTEAKSTSGNFAAITEFTHS